MDFNPEQTFLSLEDRMSEPNRNMTREQRMDKHYGFMCALIKNEDVTRFRANKELIEAQSYVITQMASSALAAFEELWKGEEKV